MDYKDYYKNLGVKKNASAEEIKKQYRRMARKYHPDVSEETNAEDKFKEAKEAYEVLKDPEKRAAYDQLGSQWQGGPPPGWKYEQAGDRPHAEPSQGGGDFSDFFKDLFGQRNRAQGDSAHFKMRGQDQSAKITITLNSAYRGTTQRLHMQHHEPDPRTGQLHRKSHVLNVKIPAGVIEGQQIRLIGKGEPGMGGGPRGDLYLEVNFKSHPYFSVKKRDIYMNLPVTPWEAALGEKINVPTLGGQIQLNIPANSQTGNKLRLKGRGLPGNPHGDQYVILNIFIPKPENDEQKKLYKTMSKQMQFNPRAHLI